ncbi:hypothetical protein RI129_005318 [Pyrocoelia pectoralis]|uniref:MARVEL domain-containing protein n=1 Tax=Pyrocoelia pectoralis TaxID=417401 RepID=A0AAN7VI15_9COLE
MGDVNFPAQHTTTTTVTRVKTTLRYDPLYLRSKDGIIKIVEIALSFIGFICIQCSQYAIHSTGKFFSTVSMLGVWVSGILLIFYLFHIIEKTYRIPWVHFQLFFCGILSLCLLIASTFFGYSAMIIYGIDSYLKFRAMRAGALAQGERQIAKETTTTTTTTQKY